jgi:hypothetical protein
MNAVLAKMSLVRNYNIDRTYALVTRKQDFEIASLRRNDGNTWYRA